MKAQDMPSSNANECATSAPRTASTASTPLVTFALLAYRQERLIASAVSAALAQTWSPLEIILSDDCSPDDTFAIMQELVADYDGPHRIKLNRNPANLGIGAHVNRVVALSEGDLLVMAAGDDISEPQRVAILCDRWLAAGRPPAVASRVSVIDHVGKIVSPLYRGYEGQYPEPHETPRSSLLHHARNGSRHVPGCAAAYSREAFRFFGPLADDVVNEDNVMTFRSWLLQGVHYIDDVLVRYRQHDSSLYHTTLGHVLTTRCDFAAAEARAQRHAQWEVAYLSQHLADVIRARETGLHDPDLLDQVTVAVSKRLDQARLVTDWPHLSVLTRTARLARIGRQAPCSFLRGRAARLCLPCYYTIRSLLRHTLDALRYRRARSTDNTD